MIIKLVQEALKASKALYLLRLELRDSPAILTRVEAQLVDLQWKIRKLQQYFSSQILSQEDFEAMATWHRNCSQKILEVRDILFQYSLKMDQKSSVGLDEGLWSMYGGSRRRVRRGTIQLKAMGWSWVIDHLFKWGNDRLRI